MTEKEREAFAFMRATLRNFAALIGERPDLRDDDELWALFSQALRGIQMADEARGVSLQ